MTLRPKPKKCSVCKKEKILWKSNPPTCISCNRSSSPIRLSEGSKAKICADTAFYNEIWAERNHSCEECGRNLGDTWKRYMFSHLITKGAHPDLRYDKRNIVLKCLECHNRWENGDRRNMRVFARYRDTISQMLKESSEHYSRGSRRQSDPDD